MSRGHSHSPASAAGKTLEPDQSYAPPGRAADAETYPGHRSRLEMAGREVAGTFRPRYHNRHPNSAAFAPSRDAPLEKRGPATTPSPHFWRPLFSASPLLRMGRLSLEAGPVVRGKAHLCSLSGS